MSSPLDSDDMGVDAALERLRVILDDLRAEGITGIICLIADDPLTRNETTGAYWNSGRMSSIGLLEQAKKQILEGDYDLD